MRDRLFLPETISEALDTDLAAGLRAVADALDSGQLDGRHLGTIAAAGGLHDDRIHLRVSLDLAAPILQRDTDGGAERGKLLSESVENGDSLGLQDPNERACFEKFTPSDPVSEPKNGV